MTLHSSNKGLHFSEPVQEIIGTVPSWIIRWGITVITAVYTLIAMGCCIIRFPQTLRASISIVTTNPPSRLEARHTGIIDTITVINGQAVRQGDLIVLLKTPAVYEDIITVKSFTDSVKYNSLSKIAYDPIFTKTLHLGDLQDKWTEFVSLAKEYHLYRDLGRIEKQQMLLSEQIRHNEEYFDLLQSQRTFLEKDANLQMISLQRDSILWSKGLIAPAEYETGQQACLSKLSGLASFDATLKSAAFNILALEHSLYELDIRRREKEDGFDLRCSRILSELTTQIATWTEQYAIIAPFDGIVSLQDFWGPGQNVRTGDILTSVVPDTEAKTEGRMKVSSVNFGQVALGQSVNVRLNGFPYIEYGILKGVISKISQVPEKLPDGSVIYNVEVSFPGGLVSTYRKRFPFIQDMDGEAEIIIRDQKLVEHFIEPVISLFKN